jgi:hypothetical protein
MGASGRIMLLLGTRCKLVFLLQLALICSASAIGCYEIERFVSCTPVIDCIPGTNYSPGIYQLNMSISDVKKLNIPTYDGSGQCVHPSVRYIPGGWAGYEWWMAFTPYPQGNDKYENPSLVASHDGINWTVPKGLVNPIDPAPKNGHDADTELIYDGKNMLVYYIDVTKKCIVTCHRRIVYPNMSIENEETCTNFHPISPAIIRKSANDWIAWYCDLTSLQLYHATSTDGLNWTNQTIALTDMPDKVSWHISALQVDNGYTFLIAAFPRAKENNSRTKLYLGYASSSSSIIKMAPILSPEKGWPDREIYRSCMVGSRVYISAADRKCNWHIGHGRIVSYLRRGYLTMSKKLGNNSFSNAANSNSS